MYKTRTCYGNCFLGFVKIESIYQAKATEDDRTFQHITHNFCVGKFERGSLKYLWSHVFTYCFTE